MSNSVHACVIFVEAAIACAAEIVRLFNDENAEILRLFDMV